MNDVTVIKVGTGVLTRDDGRLDGTSLVKLVTALAELLKSGKKCLLVSSGAVGAGVPVLGLESYPDDVETRQAAAAVGQARLMHSYQNLLAQFDLTPAQLLLTRYDLETQKRRERILRTIGRLVCEVGILPIINENDSVAVNELRIGDNDLLSARLAALVGASRLILLSTVDGLQDTTGNLIQEVEDINEVASMVRQESGRFSIGGMASKLEAVRFALERGIPVTIANGRQPDQLPELLVNRGIGTRFSCES